MIKNHKIAESKGKPTNEQSIPSLCPQYSGNPQAMFDSFLEKYQLHILPRHTVEIFQIIIQNFLQFVKLLELFIYALFSGLSKDHEISIEKNFIVLDDLRLKVSK
jgi:hypothetical protein